MAEVAAKGRIKGGSFLTEERQPDEIFTPEDLTDQHRLIARTANEFMEREILPRAAQIENKQPGLLRELLKKAAEVGLCATDVPQQYGGLGLDKISSIIVSEKMARDGSWASTVGAQAGIGVLPIAFFGTEAQKLKYVPRLASAEWVGAYAMSESSSASDALHCRTRATLAPDGKTYVLNGAKMWITNGGIADLYIVFAKVDGEHFTAFIVERNFAGVQPGAEEHKMGIHGSSTTPVNFENTPVPVENVLGEIGKGHRIAFNILNVGRLKLGAGCVGGAKFLIADAVAWAKQREAFGRKIAEFGLIRQKLGAMIAATFAAESVSYRTAGLIERALEGVHQGAPEAAREAMAALQEYAVECSILKVLGTETLDFAADEAVQIFGGYGFSSEYPVERAYRDQRVNRIFEGTNEINRLLITDMLMKRAMKGELPLLAAAQSLADEVLSLPADEPGEASDPLADVASLLEGLRKAAWLVAGNAAQRYRTALAEEQEIAGVLSDLAASVYAVESALLRARKQRAGAGEGLANATRVFAYEAADRAEAAARQALGRIAEGDALRAQLAALRRFMRRTPPDIIGLKRQLAARALELNRYPFE